MSEPNCFHIEDNWIMAHVMHVAGVFPSVSIARKNGWNKPIPDGFSEFTVGARNKKILILTGITDVSGTILVDKSCPVC
jgi:hypothetical protein